MNFLARLFDSSGFPARWRCGSGWAETPWLGWLHILSDLGVWSAYLAIPLVLIYFILRRKDLPFRKIFLLFGAFILACGTTHLMEAIIFWWPVYRLAGFLKLVTAVISWATVFALVQVVPPVLMMRSPEELEREIAGRVRAEDELKRLNAELEQRVEQRTLDLKRAADALKEERELLHTTLASIGDGVIVTDPAGRVTFLNGAAQTLTGWTNSDANTISLEEVFQIVNETSRLKVENPAIRALKEGIIVGLANHTILIAKDGMERAIDDSAAPIRDATGAIRGSVLVFRDITERKGTLNQLSEQEERLRLAVEATGLGIFDFSPQTGKQEFSARCKEIWGLNQNAAVPPEAVLDAVHPDDREMAKRTTENSLDPQGSGEFVMEHRVLHANGTQRWVLVKGKTIFDNSTRPRRALRSLGTMLDITERKEAEEALQRSEQRERERVAELDTVLRTTPTPIWISHDPECRRVTGNPASYELLGTVEGANVSATAETPLSRTFREYRDGKPLRGDELPLQRAATEGLEIAGADLSLVFEDGHTRHLYGNAVPLKNRDGSVRGAVAAFMDITELKTSEQSLLKADRRKDEFLATLAHELRNPLAPLRNSLEVMKRSGGNHEIIEQSRALMERQLGQMVRLIDDLIDVSRVSRDKLELRKEKVELASIIHHAVEACQPVAERADHELIVALPSTPIYLHADAVRLAQVFGNLLTNSCKYSERGGRIWLTVESDSEQVVITVRDTGIGIPPDKLSEIFEMFMQIDQTLERSQSGLGIGLTLVKRLVEMHDGTVTADSEGIGKGSTFIVRLPILNEQDPMLSPVKTDSRATPELTLRVLVVDDNRDSALSLGLLLEMNGSKVEIAHDGIAAVEKAQTYRPDVILLDIGLPKLNGYAVCRAIRDEDWGRDIFIVALTGWGQEEDRRKSKEAGFDEHLIKPVDHTTLVKLLGETKRR